MFEEFVDSQLKNKLNRAEEFTFSDEEHNDLNREREYCRIDLKVLNA
jgi:hypothetical protein